MENLGQCVGRRRDKSIPNVSDDSRLDRFGRHPVPEMEG
jgi:hypothetical protein